MMEADKQEKYTLLNNDSDLEEFDKSKVSLTQRPQNGKPHSRCQNSRRPQWFCHSFFLLLILTSQMILSFFVLKFHRELEILKQREAEVLKPVSLKSNASEQKDAEINNSRKEQTEFKFKDSNQQGIPSTGKMVSKKSSKQSVFTEKNTTGYLPEKIQDISHLLECVYKLNESTALEFQEVKDRITQLQNHLLNLTDRFFSTEIAMDSLIHSVRAQNPVDSKMSTMEKRFDNTTQALNNLEKRLEQGLDTAFLQISQLKDDFYLIENSPNHTSSQHVTPSALPAEPAEVPEMMFSRPGLPSATTNPTNEAPEQGITAETFTAAAVEQETSDKMPKINISFIKNLSDLQVFFYGADKNANGYLTFPEIENLLGEDTPKKEQLDLFDVDSNHMYSYLEMIRALQLTEPLQNPPDHDKRIWKVACLEDKPGLEGW
ncbi:uncharacterized protein LOC107547942 isoform X2 [Ornithorhynchus anatinus]|uniref:EF-hand domain-containing protein n=2 Tax=Ornithorhynchus anatinus TaxID=9258 RepID=A0A6I8NVR6_ORNAN|nr:uncharacterized protein LOC107547942 isoform X2 [Ornithorhynchus anatinus]XP_039769642.1 uncharacterized protein LOC107547942 isoform X2 [Ornithorhynchus anatinus]